MVWHALPIVAVLVLGAASTTPPDDVTPIDSGAALAALKDVLADHPVSDGEDAVLDDCPLGDPITLAGLVNEVVSIDELVLRAGATRAWVDGEAKQPRVSCRAAYTYSEMAGIYDVTFRAIDWNGGPFVQMVAPAGWQHDKAVPTPYLNGTLHIGCLIAPNETGARICGSQWVDAIVGLQFELALRTDDGSVTMSDSEAALRHILADLAAGLIADG